MCPDALSFHFLMSPSLCGPPFHITGPGLQNWKLTLLLNWKDIVEDMDKWTLEEINDWRLERWTNETMQHMENWRSRALSSADWLPGWLACLSCWHAGWLPCWVAGWLAGLLACWLAGLLGVCLAGWPLLGGWIAGWPAGLPTGGLFQFSMFNFEMGNQRIEWWREGILSFFHFFQIWKCGLLSKSNNWRIEEITKLKAGCLLGWLSGLSDWLGGWLACWPAGRLAGRLAGW